MKHHIERAETGVRAGSRPPAAGGIGSYPFTDTVLDLHRHPMLGARSMGRGPVSLYNGSEALMAIGAKE